MILSSVPLFLLCLSSFSLPALRRRKWWSSVCLSTVCRGSRPWLTTSARTSSSSSTSPNTPTATSSTTSRYTQSDPAETDWQTDTFPVLWFIEMVTCQRSTAVDLDLEMTLKICKMFLDLNNRTVYTLQNHTKTFNIYLFILSLCEQMLHRGTMTCES